MADATLLVLTLAGEGNPAGARGNRVLVPMPFDHAEQRAFCTYVRTAAGSDLYVTETIDEIMAARNTHGPVFEEPRGPS